MAGLLLLSIASIITSLGLSDKIYLDFTSPVRCEYMKDGRGFGVATPARTNVSLDTAGMQHTKNLPIDLLHHMIRGSEFGLLSSIT